MHLVIHSGAFYYYHMTITILSLIKVTLCDTQHLKSKFLPPYNYNYDTCPSPDLVLMELPHSVAGTLVGHFAPIHNLADWQLQHYF